MSSEDRLREGGSDEEEEESGENGEPEKKKLRKRERVAKMFERDGRATNLAEGLPVAGYIVSAIHAVKGNEEHARRAAGRCTNSNLALVGGLVGGLGGGPAGAAAGAAAGSLAGQMAERSVNHFIDQKEVRSDMGSIGDLKKNPARELVKTAGLTVVDGAMGAIGGKINVGAEKISQKVVMDGTKLLVESGMATASKSVTQAVAKGSSTAVKKVVNSGLKFAGNKATDALAEGAEKLAASQSKEKEELRSFPTLEKLMTGIARQPSGQTTPV